MRRILGMALGLSALAGWPPAEARAEIVTVANLTERTVCELYLDPAPARLRADDWLAGRCLAPGSEVRLKLSLDHERYDLHVVAGDGTDLTYYGLDLRAFPYVRLGEEEAELFEWKPAEGEEEIRPGNQ